MTLASVAFAIVFGLFIDNADTVARAGSIGLAWVNPALAGGSSEPWRALALVPPPWRKRATAVAALPLLQPRQRWCDKATHATIFARQWVAIGLHTIPTWREEKKYNKVNFPRSVLDNKQFWQCWQLALMECRCSIETCTSNLTLSDAFPRDVPGFRQNRVFNRIMVKAKCHNADDIAVKS